MFAARQVGNQDLSVSWQEADRGREATTHGNWSVATAMSPLL